MLKIINAGHNPFPFRPVGQGGLGYTPYGINGSGQPFTDYDEDEEQFDIIGGTLAMVVKNKSGKEKEYNDEKVIGKLQKRISNLKSQLIIPSQTLENKLIKIQNVVNNLEDDSDVSDDEKEQLEKIKGDIRSTVVKLHENPKLEKVPSTLSIPQKQQITWVNKPGGVTGLISSVGIEFGKAFESVLINKIPDVVKMITKDDTPIQNNDLNPNIPKHVQEYAVFDLSQENTDIEAKCYCSNVYKINFKNKTQKTGLYGKAVPINGIPLQKTKVKGNPSFLPFYTIYNGKLKLYNINYVKEQKFINQDYMKNVFIFYAFEDGLYYYDLLNDKNLELIDEQKGDGMTLYKLSLDNTYDSIKDGHGNPCYVIPFEKFIKVKVK